MRQLFVPVLFLAAVALSSSNVLPLQHRLQPLAENSQQNDNTLNYKHKSRDLLNNILYTVPIGAQRSRMFRNIANLFNTNSDRSTTFNDVINDDDNYDGEGFRKEQWHNYPRQLDRLHDYLTDYRYRDIKRSNIDEQNSEDYASGSKEVIGDIPSEYHLENNEEDTYDPVLDTSNPLLMLKVNLASLCNRLEDTMSTKIEPSFRKQLKDERETNDLEKKLFTNEINPAAKVKREGVTPKESDISGESIPEKQKTKRLFSLWSRLQSLSHKGHELPHRRHLAFYGFPEGDAGGTLTAETRAMIRPPGSPLRWG